MSNAIGNPAPPPLNAYQPSADKGQPDQPILRENGREKPWTVVSEASRPVEPIQGNALSASEAVAPRQRLNLHTQGQQAAGTSSLDAAANTKPRSVAELTRENDQLRSDVSKLRNEVTRLTSLIKQLMTMIEQLQLNVNVKKTPEQSQAPKTSDSPSNQPALQPDTAQPEKPIVQQNSENKISPPATQTTKETEEAKYVQELERQVEEFTQFFEQLTKGLEQMSKNIMAHLQNIINPDVKKMLADPKNRA